MKNTVFLDRAEALKPRLIVTQKDLPGSGHILKAGDEEWFDFGDHYTGFITVDFESVGRHQDAPLYFSIAFYESTEEFKEKPERYHGWISPAWIQEERIHLDVLPCAWRSSRRYAFRYIKIKILAVSSNYSIKVKKLGMEAVSSADDSKLIPFSGRVEDKRLDAVSVRTLHECMQEVFEDGSKRDRRLWLGDLRLQALANYETYRDYDLVRRCLYLFAGDTFEDGRVANNIFLFPEPEKDEQYMFDYSLFFISTLWDYYKASGDMETLCELEPTAMQQYELSKACFDRKHVLDMKKAGSVFIDWHRLLDKQASAQAVYIYALRDLVKLEQALGNDIRELEREIAAKTEAAKKYLYDKRKKLFVSGRFRQVSQHTQIWMVLAGVVRDAEARELLARMESAPFAAKPVTPYMVHHYIEALIQCGETQKAYEKMKAYWGAMLDRGADTFYEIFDPARPDASPYGGKIIHSFCHAWSCTPAYFLRKHYSEG